MGDAILEEFGRRFERTDPTWEYNQQRATSNDSSKRGALDTSTNRVAVAPLSQILNESGVDLYQPKSNIETILRPTAQLYRPRKTCGIANMTICIVLVTVLALLLVGAIIAIIVILVKQGNSSSTSVVINPSNVTASSASTTAQETTTTTPPPLFGYISSATYNISISGNPQYIASFDIDPRRPGGFIAVDDTLHMVYEFNIHDLTVNNKALSLDNSAEMRNCDKFTLKDFCTEVLCFESNISYCAQGCPGSVDFCAMGSVKVNGSSPYLCGAHGSFTEERGFEMALCTKSDKPSCSIQMFWLLNYKDAFPGIRSNCTIDRNDFSPKPRFTTLTAVGNIDQIDWIAAVNGAGSITATRVRDSYVITTSEAIHSETTRLYITAVDQNSAQIAAVDELNVTFYRFGDNFHPVFYGKEILSLEQNSLLTVSADGAVNVLSPSPNSKSLYLLNIHTVSWK